jgi:hypothetical protein
VNERAVWVVSGRVKEKFCRAFPEGGKSCTGNAGYHKVLQRSVIGPEGTLFPKRTVRHSG